MNKYQEYLLSQKKNKKDGKLHCHPFSNNRIQSRQSLISKTVRGGRANACHFPPLMIQYCAV